MKDIIKNKKNQNNAGQQDFLAGGGELGELIRAKDWSGTSLGPAEKWPQSLKTVVRIMLTSQQPIWIGWGPELIKLYNDPYKSIVRGKHPQALGLPAAVVWSDIWKDIEPLLRHVMKKNQGTYSESQLLIMERNGYPEETYYTFSYSPVPGSEGGVGGIICVNTDDTQRVIGERQLALLRELAALTADAKNVDEACALSAAALQTNAKDVSFGMIYRIEQTKNIATLAGAIGLDKTHPAMPATIALDSEAIWPIAEVVKNREICVVSDLGKYFNNLPKGAWDQPPRQAVAVPITQSSHAGATGVLIVGLNPYRLFDENYRRFLTLVAGQIASSIAHAEAYEEERRRAEALAEIDRAKTLFFSNVSHEFRTPLTLMLGPVQDLLHEPLGADQRKHLKVVYRNGLRLQKLVNTLLDFSRIEAGRMQANYTPTNLATYTAELASNFRSAIEKSGMQFLVNTPQLSENIYVDRDMWEKIVLNLLSNAFKFTFEGEIEVSLTEDPIHVTLTVRDTGEGIPSHDLLHIFERFKRVEGVKSRTFEGSGIGLSLVQELVKLHGGAISAESTVGKGTTFQIKIPKGTQHLPKDHIQSTPILQSTAPGAKVYIEELEQWLSGEEKADQQLVGLQVQPEVMDKPRIVLADDNADMRNYVKRLLAVRFDVITAANGKEALQITQKVIPDLLLTDIMMPEMDGLALVKALKANPQTALIPVIMLSARAGEEAKVEGLEAGADDYLAKPFSTNELIARVSTLIAANRAKRETENRLYELFMQAPAIITVLRGPEYIFELANPLYMQLVGKDRDIIGKSIIEALPETKEQGFIELLDQVYKTGEPFVGNEIPTKLDRYGNGKLEKIYLNFVYHPYRDHKGNIQGIFAHGVNVTEQVRARQVVQESERFLQTLISNLPGMVYRYPDEKSWPLDYASEGVYEISGHQPEDFTQRKINWIDLIHPDDIERVRSQVHEALEKKEIFTLVYRIKTKRGKEKWIWDRGQGVYDDDGKLLFVEGFATDITERKRAEEALEQSGNLIKLINDAIPAFISYIDTEERYQFVNRAYETWFGVSKDRVRGKTIAEILGEEAYQNSVPVIKKVLSGKAVTYENTLKKDGEAKHLQVDYIPDIADDGNVRGFVVLGHDITERKKAEEALRKSEMLFKTFSEAMPQMAFIADAEGNVIYYNQRWYDYVGEVTDTEGWGWKDKPIHHPDDLQRTIDRWTESIRTGKLYDIEYRLRRHDGEYRWHLGRAVPVRDHQGKIELWLGTNTDIHEQKQTEEALRKSEEFNRTLLESSPDGIKALDLNGTILSMNRQGQLMLEIDDFSSMMGMDWTSLWDGEYNRLAKAALEKARKGSIGHFQGFRPTAKGTTKWWDVLVAPVYGIDGKVERLVSVSRDITQLKELEKQKDDFIGIASHELKTPVTSIKGSIQIIDRLLKDQSYEMARNFLIKAAFHIDKLTGLINDLLDVSKIQAGKLQYNFSEFTAREIVEDCVEQVSHQARKHKIIVQGNMSVPVYGDKVRLEQVVSNLLTNAIKYSPEADEVILEVSRENGSLKISVTDFGIGIPEETRPYVFDRFFRVEKSSHQFQGLGIGLYICAEIVKRHGGSINVESMEGKGSTFYFTLPSKINNPKSI